MSAEDQSERVGFSEPPRVPVILSAPRSQMAPRERTIHAEIERLDADLAGLFSFGHELLGRQDEPGAGLLLRFAGRELSQGVLARLAEAAPALSAADEATVPNEETHRATIARALRLPPAHPVVTAWFELHRRNAGQAHHSTDRSSDANSAADDFRLLMSFISGRIEPYFDSQDRADALLAEPQPTESHRAAMALILVRPTLRTHFFRNLNSAAWLELLASHGVFASPPMRRIFPDGAWSLVTWVEGEYLVRVAGALPNEVKAILEGVPDSNDNPAVWDAFARALCALAPADAAALAPKLIAGVKAVPRVVIVDSIIAAAKHIATVDVTAALEVASALLWMPRRPAPTGDERPMGLVADWILLSRVSDYAAESVFDDLLLPLAETAPVDVLALICKKLRMAILALETEEQAEDSRHTYFWCRDLDGAERREGLRAALATAAATLSSTLASVSEESAEQAHEILEALPAGIRRRIRLLLIARASPFLRSRLDEVLGEEELFGWSQPGREVGALLRARADEASDEAKAKLIGSLERGPSDDELESRIRWASEAGETLSEADALKHWQLKHIRRFTPAVPAFLEPLARAAGHDGTSADIQELSLTEVGWYSGGVTRGREIGPLSSAELNEVTVEALAARVAAWEEVRGIDRPSLRGMEDSLEHLTAENPARGMNAALTLLRVHGTTRGSSGILRGVRRALEEKKDLSRDLFGGVLRELISSSEIARDRESLSAALSAFGAAVETFPSERLPDFTQIARLYFTAALREESDQDTEISTMSGVLHASLNVAAGKATEILIRLHVRLKRDVEDPARAAGVEPPDSVSFLREALDLAIQARGTVGVAARAALGQWLPQLVWLDDEWWAERADEIIGAAVTEPIQNPIWSAYLSGQRFYDDTFRRLRPFYARAAQQASVATPSTESRQWEPERELAEHVLIAYQRGLISIGDEDRLIEQVSENVPAADLAHCYWQLYRGWTDTYESGAEPIPDAFVERVIALWAWRVRMLEETPDSDRTSIEAAGLLWLVLVPQLPASSVVELGVRTLALTRGEVPILHSLWDRLAELASLFPDAVQRFVSLAIDRELASPYPHLSLSELTPVFREIFERGSSAAKAAALSTLHRAGDAGFSELGSLRPTSRT